MPRKAIGPEAWLVYILRCGDGSLYTGCTNDLVNRLAKHRAGKGAAYTRRRLPLRVVYREAVTDRSAALKREYVIKQLTRTEKLKLIRKPRSGSSNASSPPSFQRVARRRAESKPSR